MTELAVQVPQGIQRKATLLDLLDRVLGKGVVAYGDIVLSIADLDLVYLNLRAVLSSIGTLEETANGRAPLLPPSYGSALEPAEEGEQTSCVIPALGHSRGQAPAGIDAKRRPRNSLSRTEISDPRLRGDDRDFPIPSAKVDIDSDGGSKPGKLKLDPQKTAQGLAKLAMTLINLLRKLMERQAIRRMEAGTVTPEQLERAGQAFQQLDDQIKELCKQFGLKEEDLNLDLGPLGKVV